MNLQELTEKFQLNQTEQNILKFLFDCPNCKELSIRQAASKCYTSPATISHLAKKMKLTGYSELVFKITSSQQAYFDLEKTNLTRTEIKYFSELMCKHANDLLMVLSSGFSQNIANYMSESLNLYQIRCLMNSHLEIMYEDHLNSSLIFLISHSGETKRLIELAKMANKKGIETIAFVGNRQSTLAAISTLAISTDSYSPFSSQHKVPQLFFGKVLIQFEILLCAYLNS